MSHEALALIDESSESAENIKTFSINKASKTARSATVYGRVKEVSKGFNRPRKHSEIFSPLNGSKQTLHDFYVSFFVQVSRLF